MLERLKEHGFEVEFTSHAEAIMLHDFPELIDELERALLSISLPITEIIGGGGGEAKMTQRLRRGLAAMQWTKHNFELKKIVDGIPKESISHEIDHVRRAVSGVFALEIEWNNKDPFFDRDLNNFRLLFDLRAVSVGIIVTRSDGLQGIFNDLGRGSSYGNSTTHMSKLLPRIEGGGGAGCPLLVFGIKKTLYLEDEE